MFDSSVFGIRNNLEMFSRAATRIQETERADTPQEMANMMVAEAGVRANIVALRTALSVSKGIIDLIA